MRKNYRIFSLPLLLVLGLTIPLFVYAQIGDALNFFWTLLTDPLDAFGRLAVAIVAFALGLMVKLVSWFTGLFVVGLAWLMSASMDIPIVDSWARDVGWTLTRNLVNMLFIIILAWIGIATILRLPQYRTGRTFLNLLLIALLVNFSPILVGLVVDISNIVTNYFVQGILEPGGDPNQNYLHGLVRRDPGTGTAGLLRVANESINERLNNLFALRVSARDAILDLTLIASYGIFFFIATFIFFLLTLLFFLRVLAFWLLLILSPFAFVAYILPGTRRYWNMWWHQLLQWAIIGMAAAFFLYLSFSFLNATAAGGAGDPMRQFLGVQDPNNPDPGSLTQVTRDADAPHAFVSFIADLLPMAATLVLLGVSVFFGFATGAMGASTVMNFTRRKGRVWAGRAYSFGKRKTGELMPEKTRKTLERMATRQSTLDRIKTAPGIRGKAFAVATSPYWAVGRFMGRRATGLTEANIRAAKEREKELEKLADVPVKLLEQMRSGPIQNRIAALRVAVDKGKIRDVRKMGLTDQEIVNLTRVAARQISPDMAKDIAKAMPQLADEIAAGLSQGLKEEAGLDMSQQDIKEYGTLTGKIIAGIQPKDIAKLDVEGLKERVKRDQQFAQEFDQAAAKFWKGEHEAAAGREFGRSFVDFFNERMQNRGFVEFMVEDRNASIPGYHSDNPYGYDAMTPLTKGQQVQLLRRIEAPHAELTEDFFALDKELKRLENIAAGITASEKQELQTLARKKSSDLTDQERERIKELRDKEKELTADDMRKIIRTKEERKVVLAELNKRGISPRGYEPTPPPPPSPPPGPPPPLPPKPPTGRPPALPPSVPTPPGRPGRKAPGRPPPSYRPSAPPGRPGGKLIGEIKRVEKISPEEPAKEPEVVEPKEEKEE